MRSSKLFGSRHDLFACPDKEVTLNPEEYRTLLIAAFEDTIQNCLDKNMALTTFKFDGVFTTSEPLGMYICVISDERDQVIFQHSFSIMRLNSIDKLVTAFNEHCKEVQISAEQVSYAWRPNHFILAPHDPGPGKAVYVCGEDILLGDWRSPDKIALRMNYNHTHKAWRLTLPRGLNCPEYKFLIGPYQHERRVSCDQISFEGGSNRQLDLKQPTPRSPGYSFN